MHRVLLLIAHFGCLVHCQYDVNHKIPKIIPEEQFARFVSRPDIQVPKWNITVYDEDHVNPGYWFTAPYEQIGVDPPNPPWVGPHIFDGRGDLVWSSGDLFDTANTFDFRIVDMSGSSWMSVVETYSESATILDEHYEVMQQLPLGIRGNTVNMHEFNTIENGTRALITHRNITDPPTFMLDDINATGRCRVLSQGFEERDLTRTGWHSTFEWNALDHIHLNESTLEDDKYGDLWDFFHANAVDKCPDGHYLLSARHTDTIYKISKDDGHIIWRLGGKQSDFGKDFEFSRQHHIRCHSQNGTHTVVSILDNAKGIDSSPATHEYSRGLIMTLETDPPYGQSVRAEITGEYAHPTKSYVDGRGDCQILPNGNIWMGWSDRSLQSEHSADGTILMEANLVPEWLRTYRSYKFAFAGSPQRLPDVVANASSHASASDQNGATHTQTVVFVSWNGATEVEYWNFYRTDRAGTVMDLIVSQSRTGFETSIRLEGLTSYIIVEAFDAQGQPLPYGDTDVIETMYEGEIDSSAIDDEAEWLENALAAKAHPWLYAAQNLSLVASAGLFVGGVLAAFAVVLGIYVLSRYSVYQILNWRRHASYRPVGERVGTVGYQMDALQESSQHRVSEPDSAAGVTKID